MTAALISSPSLLYRRRHKRRISTKFTSSTADRLDWPVDAAQGNEPVLIDCELHVRTSASQDSQPLHYEPLLHLNQVINYQLIIIRILYYMQIMPYLIVDIC